MHMSSSAHTGAPSSKPTLAGIYWDSMLAVCRHRCSCDTPPRNIFRSGCRCHIWRCVLSARLVAGFGRNLSGSSHLAIIDHRACTRRLMPICASLPHPAASAAAYSGNVPRVVLGSSAVAVMPHCVLCQHACAPEPVTAANCRRLAVKELPLKSSMTCRTAHRRSRSRNAAGDLQLEPKTLGLVCSHPLIALH